MHVGWGQGGGVLSGHNCVHELLLKHVSSKCFNSGNEVPHDICM